MRILIDIGHPAHVHYFKHVARLLQKEGHAILFTVREKESAISLISELEFNYTSKGKGGGTIFSKLMGLPVTTMKLVKVAKRFKPDLFLSFASPYAAHASRIMGKDHISLDDTEHAKIAHKFYRPFTDLLLSPSCYLEKLHVRQVLFNSYMELSYLHPLYFTPDPEVLNELGVAEGEKYVIIRFVSWDANHDVGQSGFSKGEKVRLVDELSKRLKVFISSESSLPEPLQKYKLMLHPANLHHALAFALLYIGEGSTTAAESAVLGTPAIYVNSLVVGYCKELEEKYQLCFKKDKIEDVLEKAYNIMDDQSSEISFNERREKMLSEKADTTKILFWVLNNWPESKERLLSDRNYLLNHSIN